MNFRDSCLIFSSLRLYFQNYHLFYYRKIIILESFDPQIHLDLFSKHHFFICAYNFKHQQWVYQSHFNASKVYIGNHTDFNFETIYQDNQITWTSLVIDDPDTFDPKYLKFHSSNALNDNSSIILYVPDYALDKYKWSNHKLLAHFNKFNIIKTHSFNQNSLYVFECQDWPEALSITHSDYQNLTEPLIQFEFFANGCPKMKGSDLLLLQSIGNDYLFNFFSDPSLPNFQKFFDFVIALGKLHQIKENLLTRAIMWVYQSEEMMRSLPNFMISRILSNLVYIVNNSFKKHNNHYRQNILYFFSSNFQRLMILNKKSSTSISKIQLLRESFNKMADLNELYQENNHFVRTLVFYQIITQYDAIRIIKFSNSVKLLHFCYLLTTKTDAPLELDVSKHTEIERQMILHWRVMNSKIALKLVADMIDPISGFICFKRYGLLKSLPHPLISEDASLIYQYTVHCLVNWKNNLPTPKPHPSIFQIELNFEQSQIHKCDANILFTWSKSSKKRKRDY
jgi:hypothetical protein